MPTVNLVPENLTANVNPGELLLDAGEIAGVTMECGCVGCLCGTCAVEILGGMGNLSPADAHEQDLLRERGKDPKHFRLACCAKVLQGVVTMRRDF